MHLISYLLLFHYLLKLLFVLYFEFYQNSTIKNKNEFHVITKQRERYFSFFSEFYDHTFIFIIKFLKNSYT